MKLTFNYGTDVISLPATVLKRLERATKKDIKVLMCLAFDRSLLTGDASDIAFECSLSESEVETAIAYWRGAGILDVSQVNESVDSPEELTGNDIFEEHEKEKSSAKTSNTDKKSKKLKSADELPRYTTDELTGLLEKRTELHELIDESQRAFGKVFNTSEINILIGMSDYLGLDGEYILMLFAHCGKLERKSVRTVEKLAFKFIDDGITDSGMLEEHLKFLEEYDSIESKIRTMFGLGTRSLTGKEKKLISSWLTEYKYDYKIIEKAYEITIDSTQKPSLYYAGAVMTRWHEEGLDTLEKICEDIEERRNQKSNEGGSFNTDEFLNAAIKRSLGNK